MFRIIPLALIVPVGLIGCGSGSEEDRIALVPVTGTVTEGGKPLAGATITFMPAAGNTVSTPGVDATGPDGTYAVMFRDRSGVAPGTYKVFITPEEPAPQEISDAFANDPMMARYANEANPQKGRQKKEAASSKSEFEAVVSDKGEVLDFDVKSTPSKK